MPKPDDAARARKTIETTAKARSDLDMVTRALAGDPEARRALVLATLPVVQARVARVLSRRGARDGRSVRQEVEDLTQEVYASLFEDDGRVFRAWDATRGLSLANFCGLVAEREASTILRSGRRSPWADTPTEADVFDRASHGRDDVEAVVSSREQLERLVDAVRVSLSPLGLVMFERLVVSGEPVDRIAESSGMTIDAVYAWKKRLAHLVRDIARKLTDSQPWLPSAAAVRTRAEEGPP
jgi:RNA polymerase sigma-70 factor (ECF subfamily)